MKILIVDDHAVVRQGVHRLLASLPDTEIFEAEAADEALEIAIRYEPHVIVLDINLDGASGLEFLRRMKARDLPCRTVMFSMHAEPTYAARSLKAGADGYVCKSACADELVRAVVRVAAGERYIDASIAGEMAYAGVDGQDPMRRLTNRELEIVRLLGEGKSLQAIADTIGIAYKTVANSCSRIKDKLDLDRTADLIRFSIENRQS